MREEDPDRTIDLILDILKIETNPVLLSLLAAGPLEDVISLETIDRIEREAAADKRFHDLLGGVWYYRAPEEVKARLDALIGRRQVVRMLISADDLHKPSRIPLQSPSTLQGITIGFSCFRGGIFSSLWAGSARSASRPPPMVSASSRRGCASRATTSRRRNGLPVFKLKIAVDRRPACLRSLDVAGADRRASSSAPMRSIPTSSFCSAITSSAIAMSRAPFPRMNGRRCWAGLKAPLGVHAILGNHDWWDDRTVQREGQGPAGRAAARWRPRAFPFTRTTPDASPRRAARSGLPGSAISSPICRRGVSARCARIGVDDLGATLAKVTDGAPIDPAGA